MFKSERLFKSFTQQICVCATSTNLICANSSAEMRKIMKNPWEDVSLEDYENHMKLSTIQQLPTLNNIMKSQLNKYNSSTVSILGVAGGNGLEHVDMSRIKIVYGIDINQKYLDICKEKYQNLNAILVLKQLDISILTNKLPMTDILIANLIIEYIGIDIFIKQISTIFPSYVSIVIQKNTDIKFISDSPYARSFDGISAIHRDIEKNSLIDSMSTIGYHLIYTKEHILPNKKKFIRLDFTFVEDNK